MKALSLPWTFLLLVAQAVSSLSLFGWQQQNAGDHAISPAPYGLLGGGGGSLRAGEIDLNLGWVDPRINGGRMLDWALEHLGEPLNIIVSGLSDPFVLTDTGFQAYTKSVGYSEECLGIHYGAVHQADLGDGNGRVGELYLARQQYFPMWGTCWESFAGGHHFRAWHQNGSRADSGAWFVAASKEEHSRKNHMISEDGYNKGRDWFVSRAVAGTHFKGIWWQADVEWKTGLLRPGDKGINHGIAQDGRVAILTVRRI